MELRRQRASLGSSPVSLEVRRRRGKVILEWNKGLPITSDDYQSMG